MEHSFSCLYEKYYHRVYYAALRTTKDPSIAEDVLQETFLKAYHKLGEVKDQEKVGAWLSTIATRKAIDYLRREKKMVMISADELPTLAVAPHSFDVENACVQRDVEKGIHKRIVNLPPKLKAVFQLSFYDGLKEKEIAHLLNLTPAAVKSRLYRARHLLKSTITPVLNGDYIA